MIWLAWRQDRLKLLGIGAVFLALAGGYVAMGIGMRSTVPSTALRNCFSGAESTECGGWPPLVYFARYDAGMLFSLLPAAAGMFLGAPLVAQELEHHTFRYAWTQGITRTNWLRVKLLVAVAFVLVYGIAFAGGYAWWFAPALKTEGWWATFDFGLVTFPAGCLFAFALGLAGGAVFRRTLPGMAAALAGFLLVLVTVKNFLRPHYLTPLLVEQTHSGELITGKSYFRDRAGILHGYEEGLSLAGIPPSPGLSLEAQQALREAGLTRLFQVQPSGRFWLFQLIEAGVYTVPAVAFVALAFWWVRHRLT
ncbi:ABC transporter permease subunit [Amycolatopsis rhizosphaerae]|uniref:ABC transporter permease subunit n=1 Tax=Amycolatopsis rhizosphaerae TaxID=2053003 RepID=A0A558B0F4_9PSEU|nr:ABC transporter permease subunit [Amycolatopsis rhizosphaerae]TVT29964.1 ABC transporter permease subunit [Amycolatopsis rhizosphaerae]